MSCTRITASPPVSMSSTGFSSATSTSGRFAMPGERLMAVSWSRCLRSCLLISIDRLSSARPTSCSLGCCSCYCPGCRPSSTASSCLAAPPLASTALWPSCSSRSNSLAASLCTQKSFSTTSPPPCACSWPSAPVPKNSLPYQKWATCFLSTWRRPASGRGWTGWGGTDRGSRSSDLRQRRICARRGWCVSSGDWWCCLSVVVRIFRLRGVRGGRSWWTCWGLKCGFCRFL